MLDVRPYMVEQLEAVLPVYYDQFVEQAELPCITYRELTDNAGPEAGSHRYSEQFYQIKIFTYNLADSAAYASAVDKIMYKIGAKRLSSNEMNVNRQIITILNYSFQTLEIEE